MHPICETCHSLLNHLHDAKRRLDEAFLRITALAGVRRSDEFQAALREMQSLHMECQALRAAVERHKVQHQPTHA
jgi:hypothetical protein